MTTSLRRLKRAGFTLVEVLIVLVILAILAAVAFPLLAVQTRQSYRAEALLNIGAIHRALQNYRSLSGTYETATLVSPPTAGSLTVDVGADGTTGPGGVTKHFNYALSNLGVNTFTITATALENTGSASGLTVVYTQEGEDEEASTLV